MRDARSDSVRACSWR